MIRSHHMHVIYRLKQLILLLGDLICFLIGFWVSLSLRALAFPSRHEVVLHLRHFVFLFFLWILINYINGLYDLDKLALNRVLYRRMMESSLVAFIVSVVFFYIIPSSQITPKTILALSVLLGYGFSIAWRYGYAALMGASRLQIRVLLIGYTEETKDLIDLLNKESHKGYKIAALIDPDKTVKPSEFPGIDVYHGLHTVRPAITNFKIELAVIAPHLLRDSAALRELYELLFWPVQLNDLASFYETVTGRIPPSTFSEGWFLEHMRNIRKPIYDRLRIAVDAFASIVIGIEFLVLFPIVAFAIRASSKGPLFIKQKRVGLGGKEFTLYKFRSMYALATDGSAETGGAVQFAQKNDTRITPVGKWLRKLRLDELPQVWNLLRRDLTLIGPRPERPEIIKKLESHMPYYPLRHLVRPGLTGWALINQNYTDNYDTSLQKLQYDLYYIKNRSVILDTIIFLRTINIILRGLGQ